MRKHIHGLFIVVIGLAATTQSSALMFVEFKVSGSGTVDTNCIHTLGSGCQISGNGVMSGTPVDAGDFFLRIDTGSPTSFNGYGSTQGLCVPASMGGRLTETGGDTIEFSHVGTVCEAEEPSSPYHYNGTYRITGGTGRFAGAVGTGNVTAAFTREGTFTRGSGDSRFYLNGTIAY